MSGQSGGRICLLTTGQPSTNPRLVKEADTLTEAGFDVTVIFAHWAAWADNADRQLLESRRWSWRQIGGTPTRHRARYCFTRLRHGISRKIYSRVPRAVPLHWHLSRVTPELMAAARGFKADLYIAHNLGALPAAIAGAQKHRARAGFDIEDLYFEMFRDDQPATDPVAESIEARYLAQCDYVTAAAPGLAQAYAAKYRIPAPVPILNVFPLAERPAEFRATNFSGPLRLYWFSQTIGTNRGLEDAVGAMGLLGSVDVELYLQGEWVPGFETTLRGLMREAGLRPEQLQYLQPEAPAEIVCRSHTFDVGLALEDPKSQSRDLSVTNKVFTYILAGNAIAATDASGQKAILDRIGPAGACYRRGDVQALASLLRIWLEDRHRLDAARRASWECGTRTFNWELEGKRFLDVVQNVISRPERAVAATIQEHWA